MFHQTKTASTRRLIRSRQGELPQFGFATHGASADTAMMDVGHGENEFGIQYLVNIRNT